MKDVCNHQNFGPLGSALWDHALERRFATSLASFVLNEAFDEWRRGWQPEGNSLVASKTNRGKAPFGYNKYFDEWHELDLTDHIKRDRNCL